MKKVMIVLLVGGMVWGVVSCSNSGGGPPPPPTASQLVAQGWQSYKQKNYQSALNSFTKAIQTQAGFADAYNGAGWSNAKLNQMGAAINQFTSGYPYISTNQPLQEQFEAGFALVSNVQKNYSLSAYWAGHVLEADSTWIFTRDVSVNSADLLILRAEDYFALAKFDSSLFEVQRLDARDSLIFTPNISTDLGRIQLANEIERLRSLN